MDGRADQVRTWWAGLSARGREGVVAGVVILVLLAGSGLWALYQRSLEDDHAAVACANRIIEGLKAPSTAEFSEPVAEDDGDSSFVVTGSVDAENSFGAMLRKDYECYARQVGDHWLVTELHFLDEAGNIER